MQYLFFNPITILKRCVYLIRINYFKLMHNKSLRLLLCLAPSKKKKKKKKKKKLKATFRKMLKGEWLLLLYPRYMYMAWNVWLTVHLYPASCMQKCDLSTSFLMASVFAVYLIGLFTSGPNGCVQLILKVKHIAIMNYFMSIFSRRTVIIVHAQKNCHVTLAHTQKIRWPTELFCGHLHEKNDYMIEGFAQKMS